MDINKLKVGDRVKYNLNDEIKTGSIYEIQIDIILIMGEFYRTYNNINSDWSFKIDKVNKNNIISKLEPLPPQYKEIPIEQEPQYEHKLRSCCLCGEKEWDYYYEEKYYCKECLDKEKSTPKNYKYYQLCSNCVTEKRYLDNSPTSSWVCDKCSKKSAPKSFKFDISFVNRVELNQEPYTAGSFPSCYFKIDGGQIKYHPDNPDIMDMNGKTYTIEIKEKE